MLLDAFIVIFWVRVLVVLVVLVVLLVVVIYESNVPLSKLKWPISYIYTSNCSMFLQSELIIFVVNYFLEKAGCIKIN